MATLQTKAATLLGPAAVPSEGVSSEFPSRRGSSLIGWARRLDDAVDTHYRRPLALALLRHFPARWAHASLTPSRLMLARPLCAALAGYLLTFGSLRAIAAAFVVFEARALLGCATEGLARGGLGAAERAMKSIGDGASALFLFVGVAHLGYHHVLDDVPRAAAQLIVLVALLSVVVFAASVARGYRERA